VISVIAWGVLEWDDTNTNYWNSLCPFAMPSIKQQLAQLHCMMTI